ncbi:uncharacterized protein PAE49_018711 isoform 2-T2 [Odontesthes bonariensis]|uniref:uncharacterized protein LOC142366343 isoform X2 n=1 Tax=Odontesthes bonariensis TaxID=219752 RepID=UPI003F587695
MPSYHFLDSLEIYIRTGKFPANISKSFRKVARAGRKHFIYKDGCLWRSYRGRLLRVVRSDDEVREILTRYHDNNNHAGRIRAVKEIMLMYYWVGVTDAVKKWIKACSVCQNRPPPPHQEPPVQFCLVYGCDASSFANPDLTFHRFPKDTEQRWKWLAVAQRDEGSLRTNSYICSQHFEASCFTLTEDGQLSLLSDAVPTIMSETVHGNEVPVLSVEAFPHSNTLEDALSTAAAAAADAATRSIDPCDPAFDETVGLQEHQYCRPGPDPDLRASNFMREDQRETVVEKSFVTYNHIARYLSTRVLPMQGKKKRTALKRMAKRFGLIDGVLMYTRVSTPVRVPRSKEEVNSILRQFHDNQGHYGQGICQRQITKHFYWGSMARDLAGWISSCHTCLNRTKRKWLRCSVYKCSNCSGPVERGLGLTFHKFPLHNPAVLTQWMKAVGRVNWHPRLWSSICSAHFTENCFDRSGEKVVLHADALPTLMVHSESETQSRTPTQPPVGEEGERAFFAKYDAVELYLSKRTYPPGLSYVEKNTFRRFCKKFAVKDGTLHMVRGDGVRLVLRNRQQVEAALVDFHNELNHLDVSKCLRLLNERYFWRTMRPDVVQWINNCPLCSLKKRKKPDNRAEAGRSEILLQALRSPHRDSDSERGENTHDACYDDDDDDDGDGGGRSIDTEEQQIIESVDTWYQEKPASLTSSQTTAPINLQPRIPILLHVRTPINLQPRSSIILQPRTPNTPLIARMWSAKEAIPAQSEISNSSESQPTILIQAKPQSKELAQLEGQKEPSVSRGSARTHQYIKTQSETKSLMEPHPLPELNQPSSQDSGPSTKKSLELQSQCSDRHAMKRGIQLEGDPFGKESSSCGLEPVVAPSTKPWPVFTIANSAPTQATQPLPETVSPPVSQKSKRLQARTIIQQCSQAKVKVRPALNGAEAQWVEIQMGMVVYVCFFNGATEEVTYEMANSLMSIKLFRKDSGHSVSLLDLPGSVLFVPQDSLLGEPLPNRRIQYTGGCEQWWGAQLFSNLVSACRELTAGSAKCTKAGVKVEQGVYGQKQEIVLNSLEPLSLLLEF